MFETLGANLSFKYVSYPNHLLSVNVSAYAISINIQSQDPDLGEWREQILSGMYDMVDTVNNRPAYKVSFPYYFQRFPKIVF